MNSFLNSLRRCAWIQILVLAAMLPGLIFLPTVTRANPSGGIVTHGNAGIGDGLNGRLVIDQISNKAIIDWADFSIAAGELTRINQPGAGAAILNKVSGGSASALNGALQANGKVFVINPNGIVVGPTGTIDVGGLVLSTLDVNDADFLAGGDMIFKGNSANGVKNFGRINAIGGDVFLVGQTVENAGTITSSGTIGLAGGNEVLITANPDANGERVFVRPSGGGSQVANTGTIEGASVELKAHGNAYALAINNSGSIRATGASRANGGVFLRAAGGRVDNTGSIRATLPSGSGGRILIEGAIVNAGGTIDASGVGNGKGGSIDLLGNEINVPNGAEVKADGGEGGTVTIGDANTQTVNVAAGSSVSANGTAGAGGTIAITGGETSTLTVGGNVSANGVGGAGGQILVNGTDIAVENGANLSADGFEGGSVKLDATNRNVVGGSIAATGVKGGRVQITGDLVELTSTAIVDAGATDIGGIIRVGGGYQGNEPGIRNSGRTIVDEGAVIRANASGRRSQAGTIIIWSDGDTSFLGEATATADVQGGLVEISGKERLGFDGTVSTLANNGTAGVLLLDPRNGMISSAAHDLAAATFNINNGTLQTALGSSNVVVSTNDPGSFDAGNLSINDRVLWDSAFSLTLLAQGDIYGGDDIINRGAGNINLVAGWDQGVAPLGLAGTTFYHVGSDVDMDTQIFNDTDNYGANNGTVYLGVRGSPAVGADRNVVIGSRTGQTNVAGYDVKLISGKDATGEERYTQIGYDREDAGTATALAPTGRIKIHAINDVTMESDNTERADPDTGGVGRYAYAHIGHGGSWGSARQALSGDIEVKAGQDITAQGGGNRQSFMMIGHGGMYGNDTNNSGDVSGTITVEATAGEINFRAGTGYSAFAQIGHAGREVRFTDFVGDNTIDVKAGTDITFHAAHDRAAVHWNARESYAQLGHGGWSSNTFPAGSTINGDIIVDAGGNIDFRGGDQRDNVAQLGLGGRSTRSDTGHDGDITVTAGGDINFIAGTVKDRATSGSTDLNEDGRVYTMLGHGGWDADANLNNTYVAGKGHKGDISVTTSGGDINFLAGDSGRATLPSFGDGQGRMNMVQLGHGGTAVTGDMSGSIHVEATAGSINFVAGNAEDNSADRYHSAKLGHGSNIGSDWGNGAVVTGTHSANSVSGGTDGINVIAGNAVNFTGGPSSALGVASAANQNYVQLGLGGYTARGNHDGPISVSAGAGGVNFTGGEGNPAANNQGNQNFAMLGHGGTGSRGDHSGSITVSADGAGGINFQAGTAIQGWVQLGHGGWDSDEPNGQNPELPLDIGNTGAIMVTTTGGGSINFKRGTNNDSYAQLGHGGWATAGDHDGNITVNSDDAIAFGGPGGSNVWGNDQEYVQLGHGGRDSRGDNTGDILVTAKAGGITFDAWGTHETTAQLGHGGINADRPDGGTTTKGNSGTITVTTTNGGDITFTAGGDPVGGPAGGRRSFAQLGHGGRITSGNQGNDGTDDPTVSAITVNAAGSISFTGGLTLGDNSEAYAQIGHGGDEATGNHMGNISVTAGDAITFKGGQGDQNYAMIGNGGTTARGNHSGDITVASGLGGILFQSGPGSATWTQIGHGGWDADEPNQVGTDPGNNGNITVTTNGGDLTFNAVSHLAADLDNNDSYVQLGHGGRATSGNHFGTIDVDTRVVGMAFGGDIRFSGGDWYAYAQLGHGGRDSLGNQGQDAASPDDQSISKITVNSGGEIAFAAGNHPTDVWAARSAYAQLGHGGAFARGDHIGDIEVTAEETISFTGSHIDGAVEGAYRAYAQLGHGGYDADNPNGGADAGSITSALNPFIGAGNTYLVDGYGAVPADTYGPARFGPTAAQRLGSRGDIFVESLNGAVVFTGADQSEAYVQLGHGGYNNGGDHSGNITVKADVNRSNIGAGVLGANYNHDGDSAGNPLDAGFNFAPAIAGGGLVQTGGGEFRAGDILFDARGEQQPGAHPVQLGHGGYVASGGSDGDIDVQAGNEITFRGGRDNSYAMVGHGGLNNNPSLNYGRVDGPAPGNVDDNDADDHAGTLGVEVDSDNPADDTRNNADDNWYPGTNKGDISVKSYGDIRFVGVTANANVGGLGFVQIGHGGWRVWADPLSPNGGGHNGDITVHAGDLTLVGGKITNAVNQNASVIFESGMQNNSFAQIGHGGYESKGNHFGDIEVAASMHVDMHARGGNPTPAAWNQNDRGEASHVQLGHGGRNSTYSAYLPRALESTTAAAGASIGAVLDEDGVFYTNATSLAVAGGLGGPVLPSGLAADGSMLPEFGQGSLQPLTTFANGMVDPAQVRFIDHDGDGPGGTPPVPIIPPQSRGTWWQITASSAPIDPGTGLPIIALEGNINVVALNGDTVFQAAGSENTPGLPGSADNPFVPGAGNSIGPEGARLSFVQVGHGGYESGGAHGFVDLDGSGVADGDISIRAQNGNFYLQAARAYGNDDPNSEWHQGMYWAYGQVGHGGARTGGHMNGDITIVAADTARILAGAGEQTYAQVGHGGYDANFYSGPGELGFEPDTRVGNPGNAGDRRGAHLQNWYYPAYNIVLDGSLTRTPGGYIRTDFANASGIPDLADRFANPLAYNQVTGDITVVGGNGVDILATDQGFHTTGRQIINSAPNSYALVGHGGRSTSGHSTDSNILVDATGNDPTMGGMALPGATGGDVFGRGGMSTESFVQVGSGGYDSPGDQDGDITVRAGGIGGVKFDAGKWNNDYAQVGHGGVIARGDHSGNITVTAPGTIEFTGGFRDGTDRVGTGSNAQLGHGGWDADNPNGGNDAATVTGGLNQVGTYFVDGFQGSVPADTYGPARFGPTDVQRLGNTGDIFVESLDGAVVFTAGDRDRGYAQLGHGGYDNSGDHSGNITVRADVNRSNAGAGVLGENYNHAGDSSGNPQNAGFNFAPAIAGGGVIQFGGGEYSAGDILFDARGHLDAGPHYVQLGHGGYIASGGHDGEIDVDAGGEITFRAGRDHSYAKLGHGGVNNNPTLNFGRVGPAFDDNDVDDHVGTLGVEPSSSMPPDDTRNNADDNWYPGTHTGDISVTSYGTIRFTGFTFHDINNNVGGAGWTQLGHGGWRMWADPVSDNGAGHNGDITVHAGGLTLAGGKITNALNADASVIFEAGGQNDSWTHIGHGGFESKGNHFGDIEVAAANHVDMHARGGGTAADIGGQGVNADGGTPTNIWVRNHRAENAWVQLGHGGRNATYSAALPRALESTTAAVGASIGAVLDENGAFYTNATSLAVAGGLGGPVLPSGAAADGSGLPMFGQGSLQPLTTFNQALVNPATVRFIDHDGNAGTPPVPIIPTQTRGTWWQITAPSAPYDADGNPIIALEGDINVVALNGDTVFQGAGSEDTPGAPTGQTSPGSPTSTNGLGPHGARYGYVQVGHGGYESGGDHGSVDLDGSGTLDNDITIRAQNGNFYLQGARAFGNDDPVAEWHQGMLYGYGQVGHGGARSGGNMTGDITVVAAGTARLIAGAGEQTYVQIGHGGYDANYLSGPGELGFEPDTRVGNPGNVNDRRGAHLQNWYYPGYNIALDGSLTGSPGGYIRTDFVADGAIAAGTGGPAPTNFGGRLLGVPDINGRRSRELFYNQVSGDITVVGGGGVELRGGDQGHTGADKDLASDLPDNAQINSGPNSYAQIGHQGRETQGHSIDSAIVVDASGNDPTMGNMSIGAGGSVQVIGGNSTQTYAQIGHQGASADGNASGNITIRATENANGEGIVFRGGTWDDAYAQGGHGGSWSHSAGLNDVNGDNRGDVQGHSGNISLEATGDILVIAGTGHRIDGASDIRSYAQVGHGGYDADVRQEQDATQSTFYGLFNQTSPDGSTVLTPGIGHNGDIHVVTTQGSVFVAASDIFRESNHAAQAETIAASVNSLGFGGGRFNYGQIGHGGAAVEGSHFGDIKVRAGFDLMGNPTNIGDTGATSSDVIVLGGSSRGRRTFELQAFGSIGHGGWAGGGDMGSRDVDGNATDTFSVMAGRDFFLEGGTGRDSQAQLGNGGYTTRGDHSANIELHADRNVTVQGNQGDHLAGTGAFGYTIYEEAGGGNRNLDGAATLADVGLGAGGVLLYDDHIVPGTVTFRVIDPSLVTGLGLVFTDVRDSATSTTGTIQDGGGGVVGTIDYLTGIATFSTAILTSNGGGQDVRVDYRHSNAARSYAQIGNGGRDADQGNNARDSVGNTGDIMISARTGHVVVRGGKDRENYGQIGHNGIHNQGVSDGGIVVRAAGDVNVLGGTGGYRQENRRNYAQIGHGGWDGDGHHTGDIKVSSGSGVLPTSIGDLLGDFNDLGDFNMDGTPDVIQFGADVSGTGASDGGAVGVGVYLRGGDFADLAVGGGPNGFNEDDNSAQIGHGGRSSNGTKDGVIAVSAASGISLISGNGYRAWTQIGHGGLDGTLSYSGQPNLLSGDISVIADADFDGSGDLVLDAATDGPGSLGFEGYSLVGHGDDRAGAPGAGQRRGNVYVQGADIITLTDVRNLAQVGHNSNDANEGIDQTGANPTSFTFIKTGPAIDFTVDATFAAILAPYIGSDGGISVAAGRDLTVDEAIIGSSADNYNLMAGRNLTINNTVLNLGTGDVNLVGGWDFMTGLAALHFNDCPPMLNFDMSAVKTDPTAYGLLNGTITINAGGNGVGSASGMTNAAAYAVNVSGGQLGFNNSIDATATSGTIMVDTLDGGLSVTAGGQVGHGGDGGGNTDTLGEIMIDTTHGTVAGAVVVTGGGAADQISQIGNGGAGQSGNKGGNIDIEAGTVAVNGGTAAGSSAQIGSGGDGSSGDITDTNITINTSLAGGVSLQGGNANDTGALIGNGGNDSGHGTVSGDVTLNVTTGGITADGGDGQNAYAQVGSGGENANGTLHGSTILDADGAVTFTGGGGIGAYVQAGLGGLNSTGDKGDGVDDEVTITGTAVTFTGGVGQGAYASAGFGGAGAGGNRVGDVDIEATTGSITFEGGDGQLAYAQAGNGGAAAFGSAFGNVILDAPQDIVFRAGAGSLAYTLGGHGGPLSGGTLGDVGTLIQATAGNDFILEAGSDQFAFAQFGTGGTNFAGLQTATVQIGAGNDITISGGAGQLAYAQAGSGGAGSSGGQSADIFIDAGNDLLITRGGGDNAYAKIGNGDQLFSSLPGFGGPGDRSGDIHVTAGRNIDSTGGMFGHVDPDLLDLPGGGGGTAVSGDTTIAVSRDNVISTRLTPSPSGAGSLLGDADSVFTSPDELRFYAPTRGNIRITGATLNGTPFVGMPTEGSAQRSDEFTVIALEDGGPAVVLDEHANLADLVPPIIGDPRWLNNFNTRNESTEPISTYNPLVPASFYLDAIVVPDSNDAGNPGGNNIPIPTPPDPEPPKPGPKPPKPGPGPGGGELPGMEEVPEPVVIDGVFDSNGNLELFDNQSGLEPVGVTEGPNGEIVLVFGQFVDVQGLFLEREGIVGITPGRLAPGSPWIPASPFFIDLTDDYVRDDLLYDFETGERVRGLGDFYEMEYNSPSGRPGMSSFDVWGESNFNFEDLIVAPGDPVVIEPPSEQTPAEIELDRAAGDGGAVE